MNIEMTLISKSPHTSGVITGFLMLAEQGKIQLKFHTDYAHTKASYPFLHMVLVEAEGKRLVFDLLDGYNWKLEAVEALLKHTDFYFKRSFCSKKNQMISPLHRKKMHPLGFSYHVTHPHNPIDQCHGLKERAAQLMQKIRNGSIRNAFTTECFEAPANDKQKNTILFLARLWDMTGNKEIDTERQYINHMRIEIIRQLRKLYPNRFFGGVQFSGHALKLCRDLLIAPSKTKRVRYLDIMKQADICIGSMGLYESNGWKTGEYIAASRAIVNEALRYEVTGNFIAGKHYLPFTTPEECVAQTVYLMEHPAFVYEMKQWNEQYYHSYLRPDRQVAQALSVVFPGFADE